MRILYDDQIFIYQRWGGISRYFAELIAHLPADCTPVVGVSVSPNVHAAALPGVTPYRGLWAEDGVLPAGLARGRLVRRLREAHLRRLNRPRLHALLAREPPDVLHITLDYDEDWLPLIGGTPFVYTVHDLIPERYWQSPAYFERRKRLAARAARLIAVSENTRRDCVRFLGVPESKVEVIHHAPTLRAPPADGADGDSGAFLLYVGGRNRQKRFAWLAEALAPLLRARPELRLVCTGAPFTRREAALLRRLGIARRVSAGFYGDADLARLYRQARAFVYPSEYEGFGLPILEAFAAGCPAVLAEASCFPEVGGDAALTFAPDDADGLRARLLSVLDDPARRASLIVRGRARAARFSWEETAARTAAVYRRVQRESE